MATGSAIASIPSFNHSGVLPPYIGSGPGDSPAAMSPYRTTLDAIVDRFATTPERKEILHGLLKYREELRRIGVYGWQWLDGSFLEDVETLQSRPPGDLDMVTFFFRPPSVKAQVDWDPFFKQHLSLFDRNQTKHLFKCDAFFVDLFFGPYPVVNLTRYWFGLFSHQRVTAVWKGMLEIPLDASVDDTARQLLNTK